MEEDSTIPMNLDLNLGPVDVELPSGSDPISLVNLEQWLQQGPRRRIQRPRSFRGRIPLPQEARNLSPEPIDGNELQIEAPKAYENSNGHSKDEVPDKNKDGERDNFEEGNYFDCNICLDLAKEPVVTCCGHLFCWPCIYRWLHHHSKAKECPVCKGEVTLKKVTPIYGCSLGTTREPVRGTVKVPPRPQARRIESWRQSVQRTAFTIPVEEMIRRRLRATSRSSPEAVQQLPPPPPPNHRAPPRGSPEITLTNSLLSRLMTNRGLRVDTSPIVASDEAVDLTDFNPQNFEQRATDNRVPPSLSNTGEANNAASMNLLTSDELLAADRSLELYFNSSPLFERYQDLSLPVDHGSSVASSSVAAVIFSEINSTSSSRVLDVDGGDSRPSSRRRLC